MHIVITAGNTDNKLTQQEWHAFTQEITEVVQEYGQVHFSGGPPTDAAWQNVCWVAERGGDKLDVILKTAKMISDVIDIRTRYKQDSVWILTGEGTTL